MAPKRIRTVGGGSFDHRKFVSAEAEARYNSSLEHKKFIPERGFHRPGGEIMEIVTTHGWGKFAEQPVPVVQSVVREFFANAKEHQNFKVFVREKTVSFDSISINRILETRNFERDEYTALYDTGIDFTEIINFLSNNNPNAQWKVKNEQLINFPSNCLTPISKAWHYFISARLMPTRNISEVTKHRAVLNYVIQKGLSIDVGKVINNSIQNILRGSTTVGLGHPSVIYHLCVQAGILGTSSEEQLNPSTAITRDKIASYGSSGPGESSAGPSRPSTSSSRRPPKNLSSSEQLSDLRERVINLELRQIMTEQWQKGLGGRLDYLIEERNIEQEYRRQFDATVANILSNPIHNPGPNPYTFPEYPVYHPYTGPPYAQPTSFASPVSHPAEEEEEGEEEEEEEEEE